MRQNHTISAVIPCYNEEQGIREVLGRMPKDVDEVVVVDNNCTDRTAEGRARGRRPRIRGRSRGTARPTRRGLAAATGDRRHARRRRFLCAGGDPAAGRFLPERSSTSSRLPLPALRSSCDGAHQPDRQRASVTGGPRSRCSARPITTASPGWISRRAALDRMRLTSDGMPFSEEIARGADARARLRRDPHPATAPPREVKLRRWRDGFENLCSDPWLAGAILPGGPPTPGVPARAPLADQGRPALMPRPSTKSAGR